MSPRRPEAEAVAALRRAGFRRHVAAGAPGVAPAYRRPGPGHWFLEARQHGDDGPVDVALTIDAPGGALVGPVHRALSAAALSSALPHIVSSLEALARAAESLRCPDCSSWPLLAEGEDGPTLACGEPRRGRRPFDRAVRRCRRTLVISALIVYEDPAPGP